MTGDQPAAYDQESWEDRANLGEGTTRIVLSCSKMERDLWKEEAAEEGFSSRTKYLYTLIQEARAYRKHGVFADHSSEDRIEQLEAEVDRLEQQVDRERQKQGGREHVDDPEFVERYLEETYTPLDELLQRIMESGALDGLVRKRVEDQLYILAAQDRVEYEPGWGWKLTDADTDSGGA
ncbi:hypothetical protein HTZ84_20915 [Haloterrigena sp. SYSU A558-1]|uniref:Uncharacterized protein n=1 Tax=Haloterrigena gelatinilytica TaxID=2741724 RepID=A0ABX2LGA0_9EURY|nr:hypothetical protein [Haloterrigena gelatinilytica]NUC74726.1 hypothetical protein [Haloterrigena gelatinilytica]